MSETGEMIPTGESVTWAQVREAWPGIDAWVSAEGGAWLPTATWSRIEHIRSPTVADMFVVNDGSWWAEFDGERRVIAIADRLRCKLPEDCGTHGKAIVEIVADIRSGAKYGEIHLIAPSFSGPPVVIDGNYRAIALCLTGELERQAAFVGIDAAAAGYSFYGTPR